MRQPRAKAVVVPGRPREGSALRRDVVDHATIQVSTTEGQHCQAAVAPPERRLPYSGTTAATSCLVMFSSVAICSCPIP